MNKVTFLTAMFALIISFSRSANAGINDSLIESLPSKRDFGSERAGAVTPQETKSEAKHTRRPATEKEKISRPTTIHNTTGNLPNYAFRANAPEEFEKPAKVPGNSDFNNHISLWRGRSLRALITDNVVAYPNSKTPVTARVIEGEFKGATLIGEASMDEKTKRANITFTGIRPLKSSITYNLEADVMGDDNSRGLVGEYESTYWTYFVTEVTMNVAAGFAGAATPRNQTILGSETAPSGYLTEAVANGLKTSADRIGDRVKSAPEITTARGPRIIQVTVTK